MEELYISEEDRSDLELERYKLALERIGEIPNESICGESLQSYFNSMADFILSIDRAWNIVESGKLRQMELKELRPFNRGLYEDILPENYSHS